jgi:hypothetical protein
MNIYSPAPIHYPLLTSHGDEAIRHVVHMPDKSDYQTSGFGQISLVRLARQSGMWTTFDFGVTRSRSAFFGLEAIRNRRTGCPFIYDSSVVAV